MPRSTSNTPTTASDVGVRADNFSRHAVGNAPPPSPNPSITGIVPIPNNAMVPIPATHPPVVAAKAAAAYTKPHGSRPFTIPKTHSDPMVRRRKIHPSHPFTRNVQRPSQAAGLAQAAATKPVKTSTPAPRDTQRCTPAIDNECPKAPEAAPSAM